MTREMIAKEIDQQGRIVLPKAWVEDFPKKIVLIKTDHELKIIPQKKGDLTKFFDAVKVDIKSDLADWHAVRKELRRPR